jgi:hypothetical protein
VSHMAAELESGFRMRMEGWNIWQHILLMVFYLTAIIGVGSFLAFDAMILAEGADSWPGDSRNWVILLFIGLSVSVQAGWGFAVWKIHRMDQPLKVVAIAVLPLLFASIPFGMFAYGEFSREPSLPVLIVY